jgi:hypothetical protein
MIYLSSVISGDLTWSKISHRSYELKLNRDVLGTLRRPNFWSSTCLAETQSGHWTFRRGGWFGAGTQILDPTSARKIATFRSVWGSGGGTLTFADGETFSLECEGWWRPVWQVATQTGETLLRLHPREKNVELAEGAALLGTRLSLLILFTWYRVLQGEEDALVAAIAAS